MSEIAATALCFTPIPGTWPEVAARLDAYLKKDHNPPAAWPDRGSLLIVDAAKRRIKTRRQIDSRRTFDPEPTGVEYWRAVAVKATFDKTMDLINFCLRELPSRQTAVELWFPTQVFEALFHHDLRRKEFDPAIKAAMTRLFVAVAKALGADGFGYRPAEDDSLFGPLTVETLREYIEIDGNWFAKRDVLQLTVAGLSVDLVEESKFEFHDTDQPMYYRQGGYYLFDILWPL